MKPVSNLQDLAKLLLLILTTTTATAEQCDFCDSRWRKIYETDEKGAAVSGSHEELLTAIKRAEPVKYLIPSLGKEGFIGNCDVTYYYSSDTYLLSTSYISKANWKTLEEEPYHRLFSLTTSGNIREIRYIVNSCKDIKHTEYEAGIQLFVKNSSCISLVLEHDRDGKITYGSLDKVISSVVSGHDVRETWFNAATEPCRNIKITEDGIVVGHFVWDVTILQSPYWNFMNVYTNSHTAWNYFSPDFCDSRWHKVYESDENGAAVSGKFDDLVLAYSRSEPIKYLIPSLGYAGNLDSSFAFFGVIYFKSTSHISKATWNTFEEEPHRRLLTLATNTQIKEIRYKVNNFTETSKKKFFAGIQWFVKKSSCFSSLLQQTRDGTVTHGSLDKLISSVLSGHDVRLKWKDLYTEPCRNVKVTKDGIVVGQLVWDVSYAESPSWGFVNVPTNGTLIRNYFLPGAIDASQSKFNVVERWYADSCWKHVFTNDENGDEVDGSLSELISAVKDGHRVKVIMGKFSIEADNVRTKSGQISAQLLNRLYVEKVDGIFKGFWYWQMAHTTGTVATLKYSLFNGTSVGEETEKKTIKWFVDTKPWRNVLSTNKSGDVVFGSKADLRSAVENGADVRVVLQIDSSKPASNTSNKRQDDWREMGGEDGGQWDRHGGSADMNVRNRSSHECKEQEWTFFKTSNLELGPSGEVSAELLQSVSTEEMGSNELKIKKYAFWKYMIVTTQGDVDVSQRGIGVNRNVGHFSVKYAIKWFVNY